MRASPARPARLGFLPAPLRAALPALLAEERVHVGRGKRGVDIAERAVLTHLLRHRSSSRDAASSPGLIRFTPADARVVTCEQRA